MCCAIYTKCNVRASLLQGCIFQAHFGRPHMQGKQLLSDRDVCIYLVIDAGNVVQGDGCYQYEIPGQYCNEKYTDCSLYIFKLFSFIYFYSGGI